MPSLTNYPNARPSLFLDFANSRQVDPRIEFSRATTATRTNAKGVIETVAANVPRIDYDPVTRECFGLLMEPARTNQLINSTFSGAVSGTPGTVPGWFGGDGTLTVLPSRLAGGFKIKTVSAVRAYRTATVSAAVNGDVYIFTVEFDLEYGPLAATNMFGKFGTSLATTEIFVDGALVKPNAALPLGKHTMLAKLTFTAAGTVDIRLGIGTSGVPAAEVSLTLDTPQVEKGTFPTSYIPTTTAEVTRVAEFPVMTGSNFSDWYRPDEGTMLIESSSSLADSSAMWSVSDNTTGSFIRCSPSVRNIATLGAVGMSQLSPVLANVFYKTALAYKLNDSNSAIGGVAGVADTSVVLPSVNRMMIGGIIAAADTVARIKSIAYYPARLTNAQLQALTAP